MEAERLAAEAEAVAARGKKTGKKASKTLAKEEETEDASKVLEEEDSNVNSSPSIEYEGKYLSDVWVFSAEDNAWRQPGINGEGPPASAYQVMMAVPLASPGLDEYKSDSEGNLNAKARPALFGSERAEDLVEGKVVSQVVVLGGCRPCLQSTEENNDGDNGDISEENQRVKVKVMLMMPPNSISGSLDEIHVL